MKRLISIALIVALSGCNKLPDVALDVKDKASGEELKIELNQEQEVANKTA